MKKRGKLSLRRPAPGTGKRADHELVWHSCQCGGDVLAPADVGSVICGRCVQRLVGGGALPPKPLTPEEKEEKKAERIAALVAARKARSAEKKAARWAA